MHPIPVLASLHISVSGITLLTQIGDLVSTDQQFSLRVVAYGFEGIPFESVLGLNYPNLSFPGGIPFFDNVKNQGSVSEPVFAFYLSK